MKVFARKRLGLRPPRGTYSRHTVKGVSWHHGGPVGPCPRTFAAMKKTLQGYQNYHMDNHGWMDIGYNLAIDYWGRVYELRPWTAVPAAVGGHNTGIPGIVFPQDGRYHKLSYWQRRTMRKLLTEGCRPLGIKPLNRYFNKGHKEFSGHEWNECPGTYILNHLKYARRKYAR